MPPLSRILEVPYFVQPTAITCQSTCLKMFASYIETRVALQSTAAGARDVLDIWKDVNEDPARPVKVRNAHANMKWWLEKHFPWLRFTYESLNDEARVISALVDAIDGGFPVLVSVSHVRVKGHIVLVVGYEGYEPYMSSPDFRLVIHDPYGRFDPTILSEVYGKRRWESGQSLLAGGESGPGRNNRVPLPSTGRQRDKDAARGTYYLLTARR